MTNEEAIKDIQDNILPVVGGKSLQMAIEALKAQDAKDAKDAKSMPSQLPSNEIIYKQDAIDVLDEFQESVENGTPCYAKARVEMCNIPSAQPDVAEKLYQYKCYITDQEGLQHEVIHIGDIRRVTGWEL